MLTRATDTTPRASKLIHMNGCIFTTATKKKTRLSSPSYQNPATFFTECALRYAVSQTGQRGRTENKDADKPVSSFSKRDCGVQLLLLFVFLLRSRFWKEFSLHGKPYYNGR